MVMPDNSDLTRREFMRLSATAGGSLLLTRSMDLIAGTNPSANIKSRGYAALDTSGKLVPWELERRPVGDNDILIDIKYASISTRRGPRAGFPARVHETEIRR
jgi:uncharacterized zinc-type alcohol dehydrogenase-like protein